MSVLVILIPPRPRAAGGDAPPADFAWVLSADGTTVTRHGRSRGAEMPAAQQVIALLADADVSWHRITLPRAPAPKLRAALGGVLEEQLLDDDDTLHLAVEPQASAGQPTWVAATHQPWLLGVITELERAGVPVDRVAPSSAPAATPSAHFIAGPMGDDSAPLLVLSDADGVAVLSTGGSLARARLAPWLAETPGAPVLRCTAQPAAAAAAERWLEVPVDIVSDAERALGNARSSWNLRQFDLVPRHRGTLLLRDAWRHFLGPAWRPVRIGLVALLAVQLVGLNAWAWQLGRAEAGKRQAINSLLRETHPRVRDVLDAPAQMQRETEALRTMAGRPGEADLEAMLAAAAAAWPDGLPPVQDLRFEPGKLTLSAPGWNDSQLASFRERVRAAGYSAESNGGQIVLKRS